MQHTLVLSRSCKKACFSGVLFPRLNSPSGACFINYKLKIKYLQSAEIYRLWKNKSWLYKTCSHCFLFKISIIACLFPPQREGVCSRFVCLFVSDLASRVFKMSFSNFVRWQKPITARADLILSRSSFRPQMWKSVKMSNLLWIIFKLTAYYASGNVTLVG